jgi:hypothetical protein
MSLDVCTGNWPRTLRNNKFLLMAQATAYWAVSNLRGKTRAARLLKLFGTIELPKVSRFDSYASGRSALIQEFVRSYMQLCSSVSSLAAR